ncbi:pyridoxamine 5'-phosphate oxidase family protein [Streptomyces sp. NBC_00151]|uniref:pyridoxamine 5'-phosphate oxidase family protein n=1 Tax=Streptomyces sp. NBC_00151 TaxID=2975669 RepID=UPI002DD7B73C|nr:pyridoxamine 5'-phosphate oxidase family protein [Streptomyces sp. NBC_00151]WRZ37902.1 pyridoxamine 5'-phosphate oxidase family protein [Streptomyces sp. NBC_00151]
MYADDGFRELDRQECLAMLAAVPVGRIVYTRLALPAVLPVNFCLDYDGAVLLCTPASSDLVTAIDGAVVAFEADELDVALHSGWSVVIVGSAHLVTDPAEHARLLRTGPRSWVPAPQEVYLRIASALVTGRRLGGGRPLHDMQNPS